MNPDLPVRSPEDLSPPRIADPIFECARSVYVSGFVPHAYVQVFSNTVDLLAEVEPHFGFAEVALNRPVDIGEIISATQTVNGVTSEHSLDPVTVASLPEFPDGKPPQPSVRPPIYHCGRIVPVTDLVPGASVLVQQSGALVGSRNAATHSTNVITSRLTEGELVNAVQITCNEIPGKEALNSPPSEDVEVSAVPSPFRPPKIVPESNVVGNDSITLEDLYVGAEVIVHNDIDKIGSGLATAGTNWVPLSEPLQAPWSMVAQQSLCEAESSSDPQTPTSTLRAPQIDGPICDSDHYVRVVGSIINATVVLWSSVLGQIVGHAGAAPGVLLLPRSVPLVAGDELTVFQYIGNTVSPDSTEVIVCACSEDWLRRKLMDILSSPNPANLPVSCVPSDIRIFTNDDPWEVFDCTLRADFDVINGALVKSDAVSAGTLSYTDPMTALPVSLDCEVSARGNSRFSFCGWRPLKIRFPENPDESVFDGTGKVIKIVTHCGFKSGDQWILGGTPSEHRCRLMQEYLLYQIHHAFNPGALQTRLSRITYQDMAGTTLATEYAFFREREKRAAERCGLERLELDEGDPSFPANAMSAFQIEFHHKFLFSHDYHPGLEHNVVRMKSPANEEFYLPYDFDLSGVIRPDYFKNNNWTIDENGEHLISWLSSQPDQNLVRVQIASILQHESDMYQRLEGTLADSASAARVADWLDDHIRRLKCYLNDELRR